MHRNTKFVVICLAVLAVIVVVANITKKPEPQPIAQPIATITPPAIESRKRYVSNTCGMELMHPSTLSPVEKTDGSTDFIRIDQPAETISLTCTESIPAPKVANASIEDFSVGTISAKLYMDTKPEKGPPGYSLIFHHPTKDLDIKITGVGEGFQNLIKSVTLF